MDKTKNIILVSIIVIFIIAIIGVIFYIPKLTQKPAPVVEEKPTKTEFLPKIEKIRKFKIGDYDKIEGLLLSPNAQYVAVEYKKDKKEYLQINDKVYGPYDFADAEDLVFSEDGLNYGGIFVSGHNPFDPSVRPKYYVLINEKIYGPYEYARKPSFLDKTKEFLFSFKKNGKWYVQRGDYKTYGPYERVIGVYTDKARFNQVYHNKSKTQYGWLFVLNGKSYILVNDKIYDAYECEDDITFALDNLLKWGCRFVKDDKYYIRINEKLYGPYDWADYVDFSENGSRYGWWFEKDGKAYVYISNDIIYGPYEQVTCIEHCVYEDIRDISFSKDGSKYMWEFEKDGKHYIQVNNKTYGPDNWTEAPTSLEDSSNLVKEFRKDEKSYVQINEKTYGPYGDVHEIIFLPPYNKFVIVFSEGAEEYYIQIDDIQYGPYTDIKFKTSNDKSRYGWWFKLKDYKHYILINNKIHGPYDIAKFTFTKDNKAYIAYISENELVIEEVE
jgi:hypothetical protein